MDEQFAKNKLKPGDPGFVYDKVVEFNRDEQEQESNSWDEDMEMDQDEEDDNDYFDDDFV